MMGEDSQMCAFIAICNWDPTYMRCLLQIVHGHIMIVQSCTHMTCSEMWCMEICDILRSVFPGQPEIDPAKLLVVTIPILVSKACSRSSALPLVSSKL